MALNQRRENQNQNLPSGVPTILGPDSNFEGKLAFDGTVRIEGRFKGQVKSDDMLVIGERAKVEATIEVGAIVVNGTVIGDIIAKRSVEVHPPAVIKGNITTPELQIDKGVIFEGSCHMEEISTGTGTGGTVKLLKKDSEDSSNNKK